MAGTTITYVPSAAAASYLISENFESGNTIWSLEHTTTGINFGETTNVIENSHSLSVFDPDGSTPYIYNTTGFTGQSTVYAFFYLKIPTAESADDYSRAVFWLVDDLNFHNTTIEVHRVDATDYNIRVWAGTVGNSTTVATFGLNTTNAVWVEVQKGTGANEQCDVWWTPVINLGTDAIKPSSGGNYHAVRSDGDGTTLVTHVQCGAATSGGQGVTSIFDHVRVSATVIGDNPP